MKDLPVLLDRLEEAGGPPDPLPSTDGWELVLADNIALSGRRSASLAGGIGPPFSGKAGSWG